MIHDNWITYILIIFSSFGAGFAIATALWWDN